MGEGGNPRPSVTLHRTVLYLELLKEKRALAVIFKTWNDRLALPGENQVKTGAGAPTIGCLKHNWSSGIPPTHSLNPVERSFVTL